MTIAISQELEAAFDELLGVSIKCVNALLDLGAGNEVEETPEGRFLIRLADAIWHFENYKFPMFNENERGDDA